VTYHKYLLYKDPAGWYFADASQIDLTPANHLFQEHHCRSSILLTQKLATKGRGDVYKKVCFSFHSLQSVSILNHHATIHLIPNVTMVKHASKATIHQLVKEYTSIIKGKTILTTGVSPGGLGALFVDAIAVAEPKLAILAGRNINKLQQTADDLASKHPNLKTKLVTLDLSSLSSVRSAAEKVNRWSDVPKIDVLVNNAGIMATDFGLTEDGFESQFASNHLGHFLFTNLIINKILASEAPRIVSVSSNGHRLGPIRWGDSNFSVSSSHLYTNLVLTMRRMGICTIDGVHTDSPRLPICYSPSL
jgi:NADP-dependent 3-hydroxy acid dehydrogenase YdfG